LIQASPTDGFAGQVALFGRVVVSSFDLQKEGNVQKEGNKARAVGSCNSLYEGETAAPSPNVVDLDCLERELATEHRLSRSLHKLLLALGKIASFQQSNVLLRPQVRPLETRQ
jgi:hypothetical protein